MVKIITQTPGLELVCEVRAHDLETAALILETFGGQGPTSARPAVQRIADMFKSVANDAKAEEWR